MRHYTQTFFKLLLLIAGFLAPLAADAQWNAPYANSWIKYGKPYVKIGVIKKGIHKISLASLPKDFPTDSPAKLQLWRRGKQIAILSTSNKDILFYAVPNDGASDSLLYRPMSSRINPYFSMYSDEGAYFLTIGDSPGVRAKVIDKEADKHVPLSAFHNETITTVFQDEYSLGTNISATKPTFINSFFELGASRTGKDLEDGAGSLTANFQLKDLANNSQKPKIKLLIHGRSGKEHKIEVHVGKTAKSLRLVTVLSNSGFEPVEYAFELKPEDTDDGKNGIISLKSAKTDRLDRFSLTYFSVTFPQLFQIEKQPDKEFNIPATKSDWSRISIQGASPGFTFLDITDPDQPVLLKSKNEDFMVPSQAGKSRRVLASREVIEIAPARLKEVNFKPYLPKDPNYIIITTDSLLKGATEYAGYRASQAGGNFEPLVVRIQDIYNQFNYGEPSPVAIKKFMSYMVTEGGKDKFLFIIGKSITANEKMRRELPEEVPSIGYPASDMLLVEGLAGTPNDIPAIPVGRLSAISNQQVKDYLQKVKEYEGAVDVGWRKNVLHLNGGKTVEEISQLKGFLSALEPEVEKGKLGGTVKQFAKQRGMAETESVNITADVNAGAGLLTFIGHGAPYVIDLDIGYITDVARGYNNIHKYPVMYFNGCGVGNIFSNRFNPHPKTPTAADRITLSLDWLLTPNRGAIAVIANSFESYVAPSTKYLQRLYHFMFVDDVTANLPIGKIMVAVAKDIVQKDQTEHAIANVHQTLLQGDPALRLVTVDKPDYAVDPDQSISLHSQSPDKNIGASDSLKIRISMVNNGRFVTGQIVPAIVSYFGKKGDVIKKQSVKSFPAQHTLQVAFLNSKDVQKIRVEIDPEHSISELNNGNNIAELEIDWDLIKDQVDFSSENAKDVVPPSLTVKFNDRLLRDKEYIAANPNITILLTDDRQLLPDTALVEVFIKHCADDNCDFEKVAYANHGIDLKQIDIKSLQLNVATKLSAGVYEILVNAKDRAGNAVAEPYRMTFEISNDENPPTELIVSPNPASSYLRFELKTSKSADLRTVRSSIYNQRGVIMEDKTIQVSSNALTTEWYWLPAQPSAGLYIYKVMLTNSGNETFATFTDKIIIDSLR